ncbi:MAG TPA: serine hydrolase domain-containing protein [Streptosporangiaceae bacterium]
MAGADVQGRCDPAFRAVRDAFEENFAGGEELGAAVAVYSGDDLVVDLWGGIADRHTGRAWRHDTPCVAFSCTKAVTAAAALRLAERGEYEMDGPVTDWWPEFAAHGKEGTTAAHLLCHQAGLPVLDGPCTAELAADPRFVADRLAAQPPRWAPGTTHGYHALTYGWLAGEIVRRIGGSPVGDYVRAQFTSKLDLWIGAPDEVIDRAARLTARRPGGAGPALEPGDAPGKVLDLALRNPATGRGGFNNPVVLRGGWPAAGMVATATALAGFYRDLLAGRIIRPATLRAAVQPRVRGPDRVLGVESAFGLGFMRPSSVFPVPPDARDGAFGHSGAGGSIGLGDVERGIAIAYIMNRLSDQFTGDLRGYRLVEAVYASLP